MTKFDALAFKTMLTSLKPTIAVGLLLWVATALGCQPLASDPMERGAQVYHNCEACHGAAGEGKPELAAPSIAGLGSWYVENQLNKFQQGHRGAHADDPEGLRMRPLSKTLRDETDLKAVAQYVGAMTPHVKSEKTVKGGDPGKGAEYFKTCVACHGADGAGMQALNAPGLIGLQDWYLLSQLKKFKAGIRGRAAGDVTGMQMAAMASALPDEQAMKDVVAYIQKLKK